MSVAMLLGIALSASNVQAQNHAYAGVNFKRVTATIVLVDRLPDPAAESYIVRRANSYPRDVIMLRDANADGERLAAAVASLLIARQRHGAVAVRDGTITVASATGPSAWKDNETKRAAKLVDRLRKERLTNVEGIGLVRAIQVPLGVTTVVDRRR